MPSIKNLEKNRFVKRGKYWLSMAKENISNWTERQSKKRYEDKYKYPRWTKKGQQERGKKFLFK